MPMPGQNRFFPAVSFLPRALGLGRRGDCEQRASCIGLNKVPFFANVVRTTESARLEVAGMSITLFVSLILGGIAVLATLIVLLVLWILKTAGAGKTSVLQQRYGVSSPPPDCQLFHRQFLSIGGVNFKRCATVGVCNAGLYLSLPRMWKLDALIPWGEFAAMSWRTLFWKKVPALTVGGERPVEICVFEPAASASAPHLQKAGIWNN